MKLVLINPRNPVSLYGDYLWQPLAFGYMAAATPPHWQVPRRTRVFLYVAKGAL